MKEGDYFQFNFTGSKEEFRDLLYTSVQEHYKTCERYLFIDWADILYTLNSTLLKIITVENRGGMMVAIVEPHCHRVFPVTFIETLLTYNKYNNNLSIF